MPSAMPSDGVGLAGWPASPLKIAIGRRPTSTALIAYTGGAIDWPRRKESARALWAEEPQ